MSGNNVMKFEETITNVLKGSTQKNALDFAAFLKANEMTAEEGQDHGGTVTYKGNILAYMHMDGKAEMPGPWTIWPDVSGTVPEGFELDDEMKEIAWAHINICGSCGGDCAPGSRKSVYGKEFDNVCGALLAFTDPNPNDLECLKSLLQLIKHDVSSAGKS